MRHYGGLRPQDADHLLGRASRLPRDHRVPDCSTASTPRTRSSRPRSPQTARRLVARLRRPDRRRHHRVLHDPDDDHDLLRRAAVEGPQVRRRPRLSPARIPVGDDGSDDHPRGRVGRRRWVLRDQRPAGELARPLRRAVRAPGATVPRPIFVTVGTLVVVAVGVFIAYWFIGRRPVPVTAPMPVPAIVALARADVGGNAINETLFARPGIWLSRMSVYADSKGIDGAVNGLAATPRRAVRSMASLAERIREVLCVVDVREGPSLSS